MLQSQKLAVKASEHRQKINELLALETRSEDQMKELEAAQKALTAIEPEYRAALTAEADIAQEKTETREEKPEDKELADLIGKAGLGNIFHAVMEHRSTDGADAELQQHFRLAPNQVPLALLETRAVTPAPANVGQNQEAIIPAVFPQACASFLGVDMPTVPVGEAVYPVLTTSATAHTPAEGAAAAETTGAFSADVLSPSRIQASFFYSREDRARFRGMDEALRTNLSDALADGLDKEILAGANGLLTSTNLANNASSKEADFPIYLDSAYGRVDGRYAAMTSELKYVVGSATYGHMGSKYRADEDSMNTLDRLGTITGGVKVSAHVPAVSSKKQNCVIRRGMRRDMVAPIWDGVTLIPDEITKASTGEIVLTAVMLHAVKILRAAGFHKQEFQVQA